MRSKEIYNLTQERIFLFVDRAALLQDELESLLKHCRQSRIRLTVVVAERDNEWNTRCENLEKYLSRDFPVRYLSEKETKRLLESLETNRALGALEELPYAARLKAFLDHADRQLLVALHTLTLGEPFVKIVVDEYNRILPDEARHLYLDVCTLNRWGVPVRAGLIARASGISFEDFGRRFFRPLEHVVRTNLAGC